MDLDLKKINEQITDRTDVFYWQSDRRIDPSEVGQIWTDRHHYFSDDELFEKVNRELQDDLLASIVPYNPDSQTNLGSINSVRVGVLESGKQIIIRCHPKGVKNGYFHVESAASHLAKLTGLPSYDTIAIHDLENEDDFAFQIIEMLPGLAVQRWLESHPEDDALIARQMGLSMAKLHKINVQGFGPFDNDLAKNGELKGLHDTYGQAVRAGLSSNVAVLKTANLISDNQASQIIGLFGDDNQLLNLEKAVLVQNEMADWNTLTDGKEITGILDWDECVAGDPISDIACWALFFNPDRLIPFLEGYWQVAEKPDNFDEKFELFRLRYVLSKMTLRLKRYQWDKSDFVKERINAGKAHLEQSIKYFNL